MIDPSSSEEESDEDHGTKPHMPYHPPHHHHPPKSHGVGIAHHGPAAAASAAAVGGGGIGAGGPGNNIIGMGGASGGLDRGSSSTIGSSHLSGHNAQSHYNSVSSDYGSAASSTHGTPQHGLAGNIHQKQVPGFGPPGSNAYVAGNISASGSPKDMYHYQHPTGSASADGSMLNVDASNKNLARFVFVLIMHF